MTSSLSGITTQQLSKQDSTIQSMDITNNNKKMKRASSIDEEEYTILLLKPEAIERSIVGKIIARIEKTGYKIEKITSVNTTYNKVARHYAHLEKRDFYNDLVNSMSDKNMIALQVIGKHVVERFRIIIGATDPLKAQPGTIRGDFACSTYSKNIQNVIHASDSFENARREHDIWFGGD